MSRRLAPQLTLERLVRDLAREVLEQGGPECAFTVFCRFLDHRRELLAALPHDAVLAEGRLWELLQRELAPDHRRRRGMFFTPRPLVEFMVRSVERCLTDPQCVANQADPCGLHIIDPACGYGAFLIEAAQRVRAVRCTGLEIDGPTAAVAGRLASREPAFCRPQIVQTNPLLAGAALRSAVLGPAHQRLVPAIVGNPPWSNFGRQNRGAWIDGLVADYRAGLAERKTNLADDAIKFIRWAQYWIEQAGAGIVAFVTPNTWLAGLTHRQMRASLVATFDELLLLDLHGEPGDPRDENVFGVRSGVAVVLAARRRWNGTSGSARRGAKVGLASLRGSRVEKLAALDGQTLQSLATVELRPARPEWLLEPPRQQPARRPGGRGDYDSFWPLDRIFRQCTSGVQTKNDAVFVALTRGELSARVQAWLAERPESPPYHEAFIRPYLVAPFDRRYVYYDPRVLGRARYRVMRHMLRPNLGLVFMRQSTNAGPYDHFLAVDSLVSDRVFYSRHGAPFLAPLWLEDGDPRTEAGSRRSEVTRTEGSGFGVQRSGRVANFSQEFIAAVALAIGPSPKPHRLFSYIYAVAHCPAYRESFAAELRRGFPRLPLPANREQYRRLSALGENLVALHVGALSHVGAQSGGLAGAGLAPAIPGEQEADAPFRVGGYDVLKRWATPRRARGLAADDGRELARLAWMGRQTRRIMQELDQVAGDAR